MILTLNFCRLVSPAIVLLSVNTNFLLFYTFLPSALQQEVAETESQAQGDLALHLPPCSTDAETPENVYLFDDRILFCLSA